MNRVVLSSVFGGWLQRIVTLTKCRRVISDNSTTSGIRVLQIKACGFKQERKSGFTSRQDSEFVCFFYFLLLFLALLPSAGFTSSLAPHAYTRQGSWMLSSGFSLSWWQLQQGTPVNKSPLAELSEALLKAARTPPPPPKKINWPELLHSSSSVPEDMEHRLGNETCGSQISVPHPSAQSHCPQKKKQQEGGMGNQAPYLCACLLLKPPPQYQYSLTDWFLFKSPKAASHMHSWRRRAPDTVLFTGTRSKQGCSLKGRWERQKVMTELTRRCASKDRGSLKKQRPRPDLK